LIVHADSACPHTEKMTSQFVEQSSIQRAAHPAYSFDLALSDFYLHGDVKQLLSGYQFADQASLLQVVGDILVGIEKVTLESVFHNWIDCANAVQPVESTWSKETVYINRITDNAMSPEMLMGRWDTLYKNLKREKVDVSRLKEMLENLEANHGQLQETVTRQGNEVTELADGIRRWTGACSRAKKINGFADRATG
jgi:hypothetical protein